jgi:hypothetical protein
MKYRGISITIVLVGICTAPQMAHARPDPVPPGAITGNHDLLGPVGSDEWKTPVATVNPEVLIPDDSSGSRLGGVSEPHFKSAFGANAFPSTNSSHGGDSQFAAVKPIEKVEMHHDDAPSDPPVATAPAPRSSGTKRVVIVAVASMVLLAFRKFRRPKNGIPPKPSFL